MTRILQIVPRLPPYTDGVGDYSLCLARQLQQNHQIHSDFLAFQQGLELAPEIQGFKVIGLPEPSRSSFQAVIPPDIDGILLQYSNYPYLKSKWDAPWWLVRALQDTIATRSIPLAIMYHELPWLRWREIRILNPLQSWISAQLGQQAAIAVTNNAQFRSILESWLHHPVYCLPNFSTVGELTRPSPLKDRQRQLVIFGSTDRDRVYRHSLAQIRRFYEDCQLEAVYDIGRSLDLWQRYDLQGLNLIELGFQPAERVSQVLAESQFAALDYRHFPGNLAKSTIFAAICAHGTVPLCTQYNPSEGDGLYCDRHYLVLDASLGRNGEAKWQAIADAAHLWYSAHSLEENSQAWASYLKTEIFRPVR